MLKCQGSWMCWYDFDGLVQDGSISSVLAMEILQSCTKPWISVDFFLWYAQSVLTNLD